MKDRLLNAIRYKTSIDNPRYLNLYVNHNEEKIVYDQ